MMILNRGSTRSNSINTTGTTSNHRTIPFSVLGLVIAVCITTSIQFYRLVVLSTSSSSSLPHENVLPSPVPKSSSPNAPSSKTAEASSATTETSGPATSGTIRKHDNGEKDVKNITDLHHHPKENEDDDHHENNDHNVDDITQISNDTHCQQLIQQYGFWDSRQCDLWIDYIETNTTIDMTPYLAQNIPIKDRWWWSPTTSTSTTTNRSDNDDYYHNYYPPGSIEITVPTVVGGRSGSASTTSSLSSSLPPPTRRGRIIYHLHIHKSGGTFLCDTFSKAKVSPDFVRLVDDDNDNDNDSPQRTRRYDHEKDNNNFHIAHALSRIQLTNQVNNCNNPDHFWLHSMNETIYNFKQLLLRQQQQQRSDHPSDTSIDANNSNGMNQQQPQQRIEAIDFLERQALEEATEYSKSYPDGLEGMIHIYDQLESTYGWHQFAPYLGDTRSTMKDIYQKITGYYHDGGEDTNDTSSSSSSSSHAIGRLQQEIIHHTHHGRVRPPHRGRRRPTVAHNIRWVFVANEGSLELEPIFGPSGPYFYSTILRDPIPWTMSLYRYDSIHNDHVRHRQQKQQQQQQQEHEQEQHSNNNQTSSSSSLLEDYLHQLIWGRGWGGPQFVTRRLCGIGCMFTNKRNEDDPTREEFLRAKSFLEHFDLVWTLESTNKLMKDGQLGRMFPGLRFQHEHRQTDVKNDESASTVVSSSPHEKSNPSPNHHNMYNISKAELKLIQRYTWMDKVLYEFGKMLMEKKYNIEE